ncbi:MAG: 16S rRNA (cytidine(1402)-2'-O)-methyltransferase [Tatlockia sp.]|jgi:16S rRNA (cytidine1402-2'-O)-methyltransferase
MVNTTARSPGTLYIVATPIGNRDDITLRALQVLKSVDVILAEDTRHSTHLLQLLGIHKPLMAFHAHNEALKSMPIIESLKEGQSFALISDAGTPLISDPGFSLVRLARQNHLAVVPIPGPCALVTALSAAGVACDSFTFIGFLPAKAPARRAKLLSLKHQPHTLVFYESTHRLEACIDDLIATFGSDYAFVLAKELTKTFEHFISGTGAEIKAWLLEDPARSKGEFVFILPEAPVEEEQGADKKILSLLLDELPLKQAVKIASLLTQSNKNELYKWALHELELKRKMSE